MIVIGLEVDGHEPEDADTVETPPLVIIIDCVVAPFDHTLPELADDVNVIDPPIQNVVDPLVEIVGVGDMAFTTTAVFDETAEQPTLPTVTL